MNDHTIMVICNFLRKLKIELPYDPAIPLLGIYPKKTIIPKIYIHLNIHCSTIYNSQGIELNFSSVQFSSATQSCQTVTPWTSAHHCHCQLPEFTQTHVHWVSDTIQPLHPLSSTSPPAFNLSKHQGLFKWVSSSHPVAKVLEFQLQYFRSDQSFQWIFRTDFLSDGLFGSLGSPKVSRESSPTSQFKSTKYLALCFLYSPTLTSIHDYWKNHSFD